jgi:putative flippase GtrA
MSHAACMRLLKFSLVGVLGIVVQLGSLGALVVTGIDYLFATALAVELAILHNFLWHRRFTWRDRTQSGIRNFFVQLARFHMSNGLVSLVGNLVLMRLLVGSFKLSVFLANLGSISICFTVNFLASDRWVFRE